MIGDENYGLANPYHCRGDHWSPDGFRSRKMGTRGGPWRVTRVPFRCTQVLQRVDEPLGDDGGCT
jgi:hypothetical protein